MQRQAVTSSQIKSVGYDEAEKTLEIEFTNNGAVYQYYDVPKKIFDALMEADSVGGFFDRKIKQGTYAYKRVKDTVTKKRNPLRP